MNTVLRLGGRRDPRDPPTAQPEEVWARGGGLDLGAQSAVSPKMFAKKAMGPIFGLDPAGLIAGMTVMSKVVETVVSLSHRRRMRHVSAPRRDERDLRRRSACHDLVRTGCGF